MAKRKDNDDINIIIESLNKLKDIRLSNLFSNNYKDMENVNMGIINEFIRDKEKDINEKK